MALSAAIVVMAIAAWLAGGSTFGTNPDGAGSAAPTPPSRPLICNADKTRCGTVSLPDGGQADYAVLRGEGKSGLVLVEPGGPAISALARPDRDSLRLPPELANFDVLLVGEPFAAWQPSASCQVALQGFGEFFNRTEAVAIPSILGACRPPVWQASTYSQVLKAIVTKEDRPLVGIVGHSYGALPASTAATAHPDAWLILNAPIAPPDTAGEDVIKERVASFHSALDRSYANACPGLNLDCALTGSEMIRSALARAEPVSVDGRSQPITAGDVGLAVIGAAYSLEVNEDWLWSMLNRLPRIGDVTVRQVGKMADQTIMRFDEHRIAAGLPVFFSAMCDAYRGWGLPRRVSPTDPGAILVQGANQCAQISTGQGGWRRVDEARRSRPVCVFGNKQDPVSPWRWAQAWATGLPVDSLITYSHPGHVDLDSAVRLAGPLSSCPGMAAALSGGRD